MTENFRQIVARMINVLCDAFADTGLDAKTVEDMRAVFLAGIEGRLELADMLSDYPVSTEALVSQAQQELRTGQPAKAAQITELALLLRPGMAEAWRVHGETLLVRGEPGAALAYLDEAVRCAPDDGPSRAVRGRALADLGEGARAAVDLDLAIQLMENDPRLALETTAARRLLDELAPHTSTERLMQTGS